MVDVLRALDDLSDSNPFPWLGIATVAMLVRRVEESSWRLYLHYDLILKMLIIITKIVRPRRFSIALN